VDEDWRALEELLSSLEEEESFDDTYILYKIN
jgi:hypothetical protein